MAQTARLVPGDRVMALGYSAIGQYVPSLEDATVQFIGHGEPPLAFPADLETLLNAPEDLAGVLVHLKATLMNLVESAGRQTLVLQSSNSIFPATARCPEPICPAIGRRTPRSAQSRCQASGL